MNKVKIASMTRIGLTKMIESLILFKPVIPLNQSQVRDPGRRMQLLFKYFNSTEHDQRWSSIFSYT